MQKDLMRRGVSRKQNIQSSHKNKTWLTTLIDEGKWDCNNIYSSKVICQQTLSARKETKWKEGNTKKKSKEKHTHTPEQINVDKMRGNKP